MGAPAVILAGLDGSLSLQIPDAEGRVLDYRVEFVAPGLDDFAVKLHGGGGPYRVARGPRGRWSCQCPAFRYRFGCKHALGVRNLYLALRKAVPHVRRDEDEETQCAATRQDDR
jgi:hypothetical protein